MTKYKYNLLINLSLILILLSGCGGGGSSDDPPTELTGTFVDSAVMGLYFEATPSNVSGFTDANGNFQYRAGDTVAFYIGGIFIGEATGASVITPVSLVAGASDETNPVVSNIARLLQTLDENDDPSDGITIPTVVFDAAAGQSIDFTDTSGFDTAATTLLNDIFTTVGTAAPTLVTATDAELHLAGSLVSTYSGTYSGTWLQTVGPDSDNGVWTFTIDSAGDVTGCGQSNVNSAEFFTLSGSLTSSGSIDITSGTTNTGATFSGSIDVNGNLTGNWENSSGGISISGTFAGSGTASPSIDCDSQLPVVPDGGSSGEFGDLTISGDPGFGDSFSSTVVIPFIIPDSISGQITWSSTPDFASSYIGRAVSVSFNPSTNAINTVNVVDSASGVWLYELLCFEGDCSGVSINQTTRTVTFNDLIVPVNDIQPNSATAPITLNGALTYPSS